MSAMKRGIAILRWNETWGAVDVAVDFLERLLGPDRSWYIMRN